MYQPTVAFPIRGGWRKFLPTDLPSPHWFDGPALAKLIFAHIAASRRGSKDLTLREFVRQFRGLSRSAEAKTICDQFPDLTRLSDFEQQAERVPDLLALMRRIANPPKPDVLGTIGGDHFRARFEEWYGVKRFWHRARPGEVDGIPFIVEAALAETEQDSSGALYTGVNFSPTFEDPLANTSLICPEFRAYGVTGFLNQGHASPIPGWDQPEVQTAVAIHLTCPALEFLDRGKTHLRVPPKLAEAIADALWDVTKALYKEEERRRKDAARAARAERAREERDRRSERRWTLKDAVFAVMPDAVRKASGWAVSVSLLGADPLLYQLRGMIA